VDVDLKSIHLQKADPIMWSLRYHGPGSLWQSPLFTTTIRIRHGELCIIHGGDVALTRYCNLKNKHNLAQMPKVAAAGDESFKLDPSTQ
jgi:hypothetical protein